jgi:hypothetical protein
MEPRDACAELCYGSSLESNLFIGHAEARMGWSPCRGAWKQEKRASVCVCVCVGAQKEKDSI